MQNRVTKKFLNKIYPPFAIMAYVYLVSDGINRFGDKMLTFRTKLELIKEFDFKSW